MAERDYELFVIGAGSGGVRAARLAAARHGVRTAIAEESRYGGTCVVRGCVPKKYMVYAAEFGRAFEHGRGYGWSADNVAFDWPRFLTRKDAEIDRLSGIYHNNLEKAGVDVISDRAELVGPHEIRLVKQDRVVTADRILIATGAAPFRPLELEGQELGVTSNEAFHFEQLPKSIIVAGGGYIACEFAMIFAGLGVETCLLYRRDTVLRGFDMDVRDAVHRELQRKGVRVITHAVFEKIEKQDDGALCAHITDGVKIQTDAVMFAIGRNPYTDGLGLETAGVDLDEKGAVKVDAFSRTNVAHIYAVGDVTDRLALTPVAIREAAAFVRTVYEGEPTAFDHRMVASAVFTQPPVGSVGWTEADARHAFGDIDVYKTEFRPMKEILTGDDERALMKLIVRRADQVVIGCHIVGPDAGELIQLAAIAVKAGLTKAAWDETCAVHPTIAEELVTMRDPVPVMAAE